MGLSKNPFYLENTKPEVVRSAPWTKAWEETFTEKQIKEINWYSLKSSLVVFDWLPLDFEFGNLEPFKDLDIGVLR